MALAIRCLGIRWERAKVDFGKAGRGNKACLLGYLKGDKAKRPVNLWEQTGVYVLYHGPEPIYVGRATAGDGTLGDRLAHHNRSRSKRNQWTQLSWVGFLKVNQNGTLQPERNPGRNISATEIGRTFEGLLIQMLSPRLNKRDGDLGDIPEFYQYMALE